MNIQDIIQKIEREHIENERYNNKNPLIIIPIHIYECTKQLCQAPNESLGIMLYYKSGEQFNIRHIINLGYGTSTKVYQDPNKFAAAKQLLNNHPEFGIIDYHTHVECAGFSNWNGFSTEDIVELGKIINKYTNRIHVLFTPTHILTCGLNKPYVSIDAEHNSDLDKEAIALDKQFNEILLKL